MAWTIGGPAFLWENDWPTARAALERPAQELEPGVDLEELARRYTELGRVGGSLLGGGRLRVSAFHAFHLSPDRPPDAFVQLRAAPMVLPLLGPRESLEPIVGRLGGGASSRWFVPAVWEAPGKDRRVPARLRFSRRAHVAAVRMLDERERLEVALRDLSVEELLWVGQEMRDQRRPGVALAVAQYAVRRARTPDTLNLHGRALRDAALLDMSAELFRESIAMCSSAEFNPHAYIGFAATLRRMGRLDEAYDQVKRARRFYPDDKYVTEVIEAIRRESVSSG